MKTTKRTLTALAMVALLAPAIESCKKGEEDPAISMRTRDSRMTGTWKMVSVEETSTNTNTTTTSNDVNAEKSDKTTTTVTTKSFDGTNWTETTKYDATENRTEVDPTFNNTTLKYDYPTVTSKEVDDNSSTTVDSYTYEIKMYKDNTYTATKTSTAKTYSWDNTNTYTSGSNPSFITGSTDDTTYTKAVPSTSVSEGVWFWLDSKKNKIEIVTGSELSGQILRLSNKEIILEDATSSNDDNTYVTTSTFSTFTDGDDQFDSKTGTQTQNVKTSSNWMRTAKFEKVDNEDEKAGE
jgi:hypothetical protein